ncbi:MAG: LD-carboxypeptidase [Rickettsiales bacterium]
MAHSVGIFSPSFSPTHAEAEMIRSFVRATGYAPRDVGVVSNDVGGQTHAQSGEESATAFVDALSDPDVPLIWATRGGFGTSRLLPHLAAREDAVRASPPTIFAGYSDATALFAYLARFPNVICLHAQTLKELSGAGRVVEGADLCVDVMRSVMQGDAVLSTCVDGWVPLNDAAKKKAFAPTPVFGGNMTLAHSSLGTPYEIAPAPGWLLCEDVDEELYAVHRMWLHIFYSRTFSNVRGVLFGDFNARSDASAAGVSQNDVLSFLTERAKEISVPAFYGKNIGHGKRNVPCLLHCDAIMQRKGEGGYALSVEVRNAS